MLNIIINEKNKAKVEAVLNEVQGKCRERTITADNIYKFCESINKAYRIYKKDLEGSSFDVDHHAQDFPKAYKYKANSTQFTVQYKKGKFVLIDVCRFGTRRSKQKVLATLSEETKKAILESASKLDTVYY